MLPLCFSFNVSLEVWHMTHSWQRFASLVTQRHTHCLDMSHSCTRLAPDFMEGPSSNCCDGRMLYYYRYTGAEPVRKYMESESMKYKAFILLARIVWGILRDVTCQAGCANHCLSGSESLQSFRFQFIFYHKIDEQWRKINPLENCQSLDNFLNVKFSYVISVWE